MVAEEEISRRRTRSEMRKTEEIKNFKEVVKNRKRKNRKDARSEQEEEFEVEPKKKRLKRTNQESKTDEIIDDEMPSTSAAARERVERKVLEYLKAEKAEPQFSKRITRSKSEILFQEIQEAVGHTIQTPKAKKDLKLFYNEKTENKSINNGSKRSTLHISSWNIGGLRAWLNKNGLKFLKNENPDIFCMQEIKSNPVQIPDKIQNIPGYYSYWLSMPGDRAGVALYTKVKPINVKYGIEIAEFDVAGRLITAEYTKFYLINVYVPNSGRKLVNLQARLRWDKRFQSYIKKLNVRKPVIICGDMNVAHEEIDLANPKSNKRTAGFTIEERKNMSKLLASDFVDTFRYLYPDHVGAYTFWTYRANARSRNIGWRLDYFIVSKRIINRVVDHVIESKVKGSDHCPISLFIKI